MIPSPPTPDLPGTLHPLTKVMYSFQHETWGQKISFWLKTGLQSRNSASVKTKLREWKKKRLKPNREKNIFQSSYAEFSKNMSGSLQTVTFTTTPFTPECAHSAAGPWGPSGPAVTLCLPHRAAESVLGLPGHELQPRRGPCFSKCSP